jgi:DNA repair protein RecO (recombination protein O)
MQWADAAIILSVQKLGETSAVLRLLTREHGVAGGMLRGVNSKANRGIAQVGNVVSAQWQARLAEQLGTLKLEMLEAHAAHLMHNATLLHSLSSACALVQISMPERHPYPRLFFALHSLLHTLEHSRDWAAHYVLFELTLLKEAGFGLDLSTCAATGGNQELVYVSPKSGRAVCREAGLPYHDKMLTLPEFIRADTHNASPQEILAGLALTGYFLDVWLLGPQGKKLPAARTRLIECMKELEAHEK